MFERFVLDVRADGTPDEAGAGSEIPLTLVLRNDAAADIRPATGVTPDGNDPAAERYELAGRRATGSSSPHQDLRGSSAA